MGAAHDDGWSGLHCHAPSLADRRLRAGLAVRQRSGARRRSGYPIAGQSTWLTQRHVDAFDPGEFHRAALQQVVGVMRLDPVLEELHRYGDTNEPPVEILEFHGREPARID